jgi:CNT family concentrative nucleoside transporter
MDRIGFLGIGLLLALAYALSNNRKAINWRLVITGLAMQWVIALFILKVPLGQLIFQKIAAIITRLLAFSDAGGAFVFGPLVSQPGTMVQLFGPGGDFIFALKLIPTIIFVSVLVAIAYHLGVMQRVVQGVAWLVSRIMGASGSEALSNVASIFVGQVEAQLLIKPYIASMTRSELLAVMAGSMACIAGGVMAVYIQMGVSAAYLLTASLMAAPGALVIAKLLYPETETSPTQGSISLAVEPHTANLLDAVALGASDGMKIGLQVVAMLIGFLALLAMVDYGIGKLGLLMAHAGMKGAMVGVDLMHLSLRSILGSAFSGVAFLLGVPWQDAHVVGGWLGTKLVANEFLAYADMTAYLNQVKPLTDAGQAIIPAFSAKSTAIASVALCGFANFGSVAIQIGGIGEMAPTRKADLARLGLKALLCGTMASYVSAAITGILLSF